MSTTTEVGKLAVELAFEAGNAGKQIKAFDKDIFNLEKGFKAGAKGVKDYEKTYTGLDAKIQKTSKQLEGYSAKLKLQKEEYTKLESTVSKQKAKLDELESTLGKGSKEWQQQAQLVQKNSEKLNKLGTDIKGTEGNINKLTKELDKAEQEFNQLGNETQSLDDKLSEVDRQTALTKSELNKLASTSGKSGEGLKSLGNDMAQVENKLEAGKQKVSAYDSEIKRLFTELEMNKNSHKTLGTEITKTETELSKATREYGENSTEALQLKAKLLALKDEYNSLEKEIDENGRELTEYRTALNNTQTDVNNLSRELNQMPFDRVGQSMEKAGQKIKGVGQSLTVGVTTPIAAAGTAAAVAGTSFGTAMSTLQATAGITDKTTDSYKKLEAKALEMGASTSFGASEAAEGLQFLALAGWDVETQVARIEPVLRAAEAGGIGLGRAADLITDSMSSASIESQDFAKYLDIVAQAQRKSNTTMEQMLEAYVGAGGMFKSLNMPLAESGALLGVLANRGTKGSEAANGLISVFSNLIGETGQAGKALNKLNISLYTSSGKQKNMTELLKEMAKKLGVTADGTSKLTQKQQQQYAAMIGGKTQFDVLMKLLAGVSGEYDELHGQLVNSNGSLEEMARIMKDNLGGSIEGMKSAIEGALLKAFVSMEPVLQTIVDLITEAANWFSNLDEGTQKTIVTIGALLACVGPLLMGLGQLIIVGGNAVTLFGGLTAGAGATGIAASGLTGKLAMLAGPAGLIALGVALVGAMAYIGDSESAILSLQDKFGGLGFVIGAVCEFISGIVQLTFGNIIITIMGVCDIIAAIMDGPGGATVKDAWGRMNANLEMNTNEAMGKMLLTTSRGMSQMGAMSEFELTNMVTAMDGIMGQIPLIVDGKYSEASQGIVKHLNAMDHNQLLALQGMNDTTKAMFTNIRADMTIAEKTNEVAFNIKRMQQSGKFDAQTMQKDLSGAFDTIKSRITTTTKEAANAANTNTKGMGTNVAANAKQTEQQVATAMTGTKTQIDTNTKGASQVADKNTKDLSTKVDANTKDVKQKVDKNTKDMATSTKTNAEAMKNSAVSSAQQMQRQVVTATQAMANSAISNWNSIRNAYSRGITGNVAINRTISTVNRAAQLNGEGINTINYDIPKIDISQYRTKATEILPRQFSNLKFAQFNMDKQLKNLESKLLNAGGDIKIDLHLDNITINNNDDYKIAAKKLVNEMLIEMEKEKIKTKKYKGR